MSISASKLNSEIPIIIGKSKEIINEIYQLIDKVARTDSTVMLQGESGTGKGIVAEVIHLRSPRSKGPFIKVNCAALTETLLASELFGHVKGSFTGAIQSQTGRFIQAESGTIFLDEISSFSLASQAKLLRVIQEGEFELVGSSVTKKTNVRIIVASNSDLKTLVEKDHFRGDLYYRLNVFQIYISPIRERSADIPLLAKHFLEKYNSVFGKKIRGFSYDCIDLLKQHTWPGNVRELENAVEHACIVCNGSQILPANLPSNLRIKDSTDGLMNGSTKMSVHSKGLSLRDKLNLAEKKIIQETLIRTNGIKKHAAEILQIDPRNFPYLLRKHDL